MGLFLNSNGYYYVELKIDGKRIQKSLRTKSKIFAQDLYHVILREKLLREFFPTPQPITNISTPPISIKQDKRKIRATTKIIDKYIKNCESRSIGHRAIEDKKRTFSIN